jgi:hypothetical protein
MAEIIIKPQPGYQEKALSSMADIVIGGGTAGCGKSFCLLLDCLRYCSYQGYQATIFRRESVDIRKSGGLWDTSQFYRNLRATPNQTMLSWTFRNQKSVEISRIQFAHLQLESDIYSYQGSQIPYIGFDELTHFTKKQFFYMLSRNRSVCGVKPCVRATCNPEPDSWVAELIAWWINPDSGFPISERDGVVRYFAQKGDGYIWGDTPEQVIEQDPERFNLVDFPDRKAADLIKSITFISGKLAENKALNESNPEYIANLLNLSDEERSKLFDGNWKVTQNNLDLFNYQSTLSLFNRKDIEPGNVNIVVDVAGYGQDLAVVTTKAGMRILAIDILTKSSPQSLLTLIEKRRLDFNCSPEDVLVDSDGMGWGLSGNGYSEFYGDSRPLARLDDPNGVPEQYQNLKTQCWYKLSEVINENKMEIDFETMICTIDGIPATSITLNSRTFLVKDLIKQDLRAIKRKDPDREGKKRTNSKAEQKEILRRSPDIGDTLMMSMWFEISKQEISMDDFIQQLKAIHNV